MAKSKGKSPESFSPRQRKTLLTFAEALLPNNVGTPLPATEDNLILPVEDYLRKMGPTSLRGFGFLLNVIEYGALIFLPRFKTFSNLSEEQRIRYLEGWEKSRLSFRRFSLVAVKMLVTMVFLNDNEIRTALGYDTACIVET